MARTSMGKCCDEKRSRVAFARDDTRRPRSVLEAFDGSPLSCGRSARSMPPLTLTRVSTATGGCAHVSMSLGAEYARRNAHCVLSLDNLSYTAVPIALGTPQVCPVSGTRGALGLGILTSGVPHPIMRVFGMRIGGIVLPEDSRISEQERIPP